MAVQLIGLRLGTLEGATYLTVKDLDYDGAAYTLKTDAMGGRITLRAGKTLIAYLEAGKVVSKVVTVTADDAGKEVLDLAVDLAAYNEANAPIPEDVSEVVAALATLRSRVLALEQGVAALPSPLTPADVTRIAEEVAAAAVAAAGTGSGLSEEDVNTLIAAAVAGLPQGGAGGLSETDVRRIVEQAVAAAGTGTGLSADDVNTLIAAALEDFSPAATPATPATPAARTKGDVFEVGSRLFSPVTYFWPDYYEDDSQWAEATRYGDDTGFVILNRDSGSWDAYDEDFNTQGLRALGRGAKVVLFYVKTQYGAAGNTAWQEGVPNPDRYTHDYIMGMIDNVKAQYPALTSDDTRWGVFLDEFINGWADQEVRVEWYQTLISRIRATYPDIWLVGNPGVNVSPAVLALDVDVLMSFEGDADRYVRNDPASPVHPDHMAAEPSTRFWHVVHGVTQDNVAAVLAAATGYGVSHLYLTNLTLVENPDNGGQWQPEGNPYAEAPGDWLRDPTASWLARTEGVEARVKVLEGSTAGTGVLTGATVLVLGAEDPVPEGTPSGTIIIREAA